MHTAEHRAISNTCQLHASARQAYNVRLHERGQGGPPAAGCLGALAGWRLPCKSTRRLSACPPCPCTGACSSMQRMGTWCGSAVSWGRRHLVTHQTEGCFASGTPLSMPAATLRAAQQDCLLTAPSKSVPTWRLRGRRAHQTRPPCPRGSPCLRLRPKEQTNAHAMSRNLNSPKTASSKLL